MYFFVFGLAGRFAEWCGRVTAAIAGNALGPIEIIEAETLEDLALRAIRGGSSSALVVAQHPGGRLRAALVEHQRRAILALDDPANALADLVLGQGVELPAAVQALASGCAVTDRLAAAPGTLVLRPSAAADPGAAALAIADHLGLPLSPAEAQAIVASSGDIGARFEGAALSAWWTGLADDERELASGALRSYLDPDANREVLTISWMHGLFFRGDQPGERVMGPVDITGRARVLIEGPRIVLPAGAWSIAVRLALSRAAIEHEFRVELLADRPLAAGTILPHPHGNPDLALDFTIEEATERPVTLRISTVRAAFDGAVAVERAALIRAAPAGAATTPAEGLALADA